MQTTERPATGPARGASPVRGVVLVAVAVVLGFFVLRALDDTGAGSDAVETGSTPPASEPEQGGGDTTAAPDTTEPTARPPAEVTVIVANGSGVDGAASQQSDAIRVGGYQVVEPTNAPELVDATQVLPTAGFEAEAEVLAADIGAPAEAVQPMPDPPPVELADANILVILGPDLTG